MIFQAQRLGHDGIAVEDRVMPGGHRDFAELAAGRAIQLHVPARHRRVELRRRNRAERHLIFADKLELRHLVHACADAPAGSAVASDRNEYMTAKAGAYRKQGALHGRNAARAAKRRGG